MSELCSLLKMISFKEMFQTYFFMDFFAEQLFSEHPFWVLLKKKNQICHMDVICLPSFYQFNQYAYSWCYILNLLAFFFFTFRNVSLRHFRKFLPIKNYFWMPTFGLIFLTFKLFDRSSFELGLNILKNQRVFRPLYRLAY